ncbi:ankyrin repeat domain-containing protein [Aspergillus mulundensis]|uniref:Uncharacterized protein n=1 Tax=Aspergillus mulundensis TaxID=1810919 RepID=A0A3D8R4T3_9EURO|nr:hypothetical protein DSM5745_08701 [Aspergillus mulundensis]RDW68941.1 hypothetical protein DSM5745_08701 [Aspergillus mulundensis]
MSWNTLPAELQTQVFAHLANIDPEVERHYEECPPHMGENRAPARKRLWGYTVNYFLVCQSWRTELRKALVCGEARQALLHFGPEELALEALRTFYEDPRNKDVDMVPKSFELAMATQRPLVSCMEYLIENGAAVAAAISPDYRLLVSYTVEKQNMEATKLLLEHKAPVEARGRRWGSGDPCQNTPLGMAILHDQLEFAKVLMDAGGDPEAPIDHPGGIEDAAQLLARREDTALLDLILNHEDENVRFRLRGRNASYQEHGRMEYIEEDEMVFGRWVQPTGQPRHPLTIAIKADNVEEARLLLAAGGRLDFMRRGIADAKSEEMRELLRSYC